MNTEMIPFELGVFEGRNLATIAYSSRAGREESRQAYCVPYGSVHPIGSSLLFWGDPAKKSYLTKEESPSRCRKWGLMLGS